MAFRLGKFLIEGELDNTTTNSTNGWLHLRGGEQIVKLELTGNPCDDLQGCRMRFEPGEIAHQEFAHQEERDPDDRPEVDLSGLAVIQTGAPGRITADQWCRVLQQPVSEMMKKDGGTSKSSAPKWHRLLYLEWFGKNGRMVLELPEPQITFLEGDDPWDPEEHTPPDVESGDKSSDASDLDVVSIQNGPGDTPTVQRHSGDQQPEDEWDLLPDDLDEQIEQLLENADREAFLNDPDDITPELKLMDYLIEEGEGKPLCVLLEEPDNLPAPDRLNEEGARRLVNAILIEMAFHNIALHMCPHYSYLDTYRLMINELFTDQFFYSQLQGTGWTQNYMTSDFCEICEREAEEEYERMAEEIDLEEQQASGPPDPEQELQEAITEVRTALEELRVQLGNGKDGPDNDLVETGECSPGIPGMERLLVLIPVMLKRLNQDLLAGNVQPDYLEQKNRVLDGLQTLENCLHGMRSFDETNLLDTPLRLFSEAIDLGTEVKWIPAFANSGRFFDDVARMLPDVKLVHHRWTNMQRNRLRQPDVPEGADRRDPDAWCTYFEEKTLAEEPLIRVPEYGGLSRKTVERGMQQQKNKHEKLEEKMEREQQINDLALVRSTVFDPNDPESFLDREEMPDREEFSEADLERNSDGSFTSEETEYEQSISALRAWAKVKYDDVAGPQSDWQQQEAGNAAVEGGMNGENDPVVEWFRTFSTDLSDRIHDLLEKENQNAPLLEYVRLLSIKPGPRISGSYTWVEDAYNPAPLKGAYLHAIACLRRVQKAIALMDLHPLEEFSDRAENGIAHIQQVLREGV